MKEWCECGEQYEEVDRRRIDETCKLIEFECPKCGDHRVFLVYFEEIKND